MKKILCILGGMTIGVLGFRAEAGIFSMPHFVEPEQFSLGFEPELTLNNGAGLGANLKYTLGVSDLLNGMGVIGAGSGPKNFRLGAAAIFDFFPDTEGQPGVGLGVQGIYFRRRDVGRFELTAIPYIHKMFSANGWAVEPFAGFPIGGGFRAESTDSLMDVVMGVIVSKSENFKYVAELGIDVSNSDTYVAGGFVYYH